MTTMTVNLDGRITIPAAIRRKLGWGKGTLVDVIKQDDDTWILRTAVMPEEHKAAEETAQTEGPDR